MAQRKNDQKIRSGGARKSESSGAGKGRKKQEAYVEEEVPAFLQAEVMIIAAFAAAVLLFLSNFHLCGVVGDLLRGVQLGMFGMIGYVFPLLLFVGTTFYLSNRGNRKAVIKLAAVIAVALTLCGLVQMLFGAELLEGESLLFFYESSAESGSGGGLVGGLLALGLRSVVGSIGAYLVFLAILIICGVCITERSVVNAVKSGSGQAYQYAKEDAIRRRAAREERQEERRRLREENVVRGVDFSATAIGQGMQPEPGGIDALAERLSEQETIKQESAKGRSKKQVQALQEAQLQGSGNDPDSVWADGGAQPYGGTQAHGSAQAHGPAWAKETGQMPGGASAAGRTRPSREEGQTTVRIWETGGEGAARQAGGPSPADVFSGRIEYPPEYEEPVPFEEDKPGEKEEPREKLHSFTKRPAAKRKGPLYADRETRTLEEMDVLPVPDLPGPGELQDLADGLPAADGVAGSASLSVSELSADFGERGLLSEDVGPAGEPLALNGAENGLNGTERAYGAFDAKGMPEADPGGTAQPGAGYPGADQIDMTSVQPDPKEDTMLDEDWADEDFLDDGWGDDMPAGYGQPGGISAGDDQLEDAFSGAERTDSRPPMGSMGAERSAGSSVGRGGSLYVPEGERRVVTATGKVIETETELLQKRLEKRREEAVDGATKEAVYAAVKAPEPKKEYVFPPTTLLKKGDRNAASFSEQTYKDTAIKLQQTLRDFGVGVTVTNISCGPSVTRYELHPEQGVKVSKIVGLADDIKLSLAAEEIRIEAPIPGKSAVGIEVPNKETSMVYLRDLLEAESFKNSASRLTFAVGKDIAGQPVMADIAKMPHLLIAGATGSGKSVCINTLIMSILFKSDPEDVKLIMVDPKVVELSVYNGIPHLLIPVVTDPKKASGALNWAVAEMEDRYRRFAEYNVRNLQGYNEKIKRISGLPEGEGPKKMPQIVIIIDELADLMMVVPGEVEDAICRLAQLARAAGIHLVIATQRPSVNVITGLIKANVPSRIAFAVSSGVDSRTIIDMNGAEKLLGKGDMLFFPSGIPKPQRVQGAFISDQEVSQVVDFLTEQGLTATYDPGIEDRVLTTATGGSGGDSSRDEYFDKAGRFIIEKEKASIGMLQRVFKIGFNRAARIMDQLADAGVVGEEEGTKPRKVLMTMEEFEALIGGGG